MKSFKAAFLLTIALLLAGVVGCGRAGPKTYAVAGVVTLDGKPLPEGLISFRTVENGSIETMNIKNGQFHGVARDGERRVEIYVMEMKKQEIGGMQASFKRNVLPARYNTATTLTAKVASDGRNEYAFALESK